MAQITQRGYLRADNIVLYVRFEEILTDLCDYKFYCFDGVPQYCQVISDRSTNETIDFFDMGWNHQEFTGLALPHHPYPFSEKPIPKPVTFEDMKRAAAILSNGVPFLRVDFYEVNGELYVGELTFYPASGFGTFTPDQWNEKLGQTIKLPGGYLVNSETLAWLLAAKQMPEKQTEDLLDYKFMCFNGEVKCCFVCSERYSDSGLKVTFFDNNWQVLPFERHYPKSEKPIAKPQNYEEMVTIAQTLAKDMPFVRVDLYEVQNKVYVGELTLYPGCGMEEFTPPEWDAVLGSWLKLPNHSKWIIEEDL